MYWILVVTMIHVKATIEGKQASRSGECGSVKPMVEAVIVNSRNNRNMGCGRRLMIGGVDGEGALRPSLYWS